MRALLAVPGLEGGADPVRVAALVLLAKASVGSGVVEIRAGELGRWIGLSASRVSSAVVPALRGAGVAEIETAEGEFGEDRGLRCTVVALRDARGMAGHPLALSKKELATLLRFLEGLFAPGWVRADGSGTRPGLLAGRRGRGAATDRLGLLLLALEARENGRVRLCGGRVDKQRGRVVATMARLLGCGLPGAERVLERLEDFSAVQRPRAVTRSDLSQRSRLVIPAVVAAHRAAQVRSAAREDRTPSMGSSFLSPDDAARPGNPLAPERNSQVTELPEGPGAGFSDPDDAATLHTDHPPMVTQAVRPQLSGGFSGEGRGAEGRQPERVCAGEDQAVDGETLSARTGSSVAEGGPLRGEKPKKSPADERMGQQRRVSLPADLPLRVALGPVAWLWKQLSGWQMDQVEAATKAELAQLAGLGVAPEGAPRLLADRLTDRLEETGGEALVDKPYGWLIGRGLPQRPGCSDLRCDDGTRLDTRAECENCHNVIHLRRGMRAQVRREIDRKQPGLGDDERRRAVEARLRQRAAVEAEDFVWRREQARAEQARRDAASATAAERAEREREAAAAADAVRQVLACEDCGQERAAGLCEACGYRRRTEALIAEAGMVAATWSADLADPGDVVGVATEVRAAMEREIAVVHAAYLRSMDPADHACDPVGTASVLAFGALNTVEQAAPEYRRTALAMLGRSEEAETEARRAYRTEQGRRWFRHNPTGADAVAAATKAADAARERAAEYLLAAGLEQLREQAAARTEQAAATPWTDRLAGLAARPLDGDTAGAMIV